MKASTFVERGSGPPFVSLTDSNGVDVLVSVSAIVSVFPMLDGTATMVQTHQGTIGVRSLASDVLAVLAEIPGVSIRPVPTSEQP